MMEVDVATKKKEVGLEALDEFLCNPELEDDGVWRTDNHGRRFLVAYAENPKYQAKLQRLMRPQMAILKRDDDEAFKLRDFLAARALSGTVLLAWEGSDSHPLPAFDVKQVEAILSDRKYRPLRSRIEQWASEESAYLDASVEDAVKN